ncbi:cation:proton antiporter [Bordetella hinzii]|uniref:cation:proton antiporter domain-containing protein n=1 Tax=Bordetella hinzii TaxID=103855 RepID=UPI00197AE0AB|nr:cation:proton antiporter [Bordetella hinzii]
MLINLLLLLACLLAIISLVQAVAARLVLPEASMLCLVGIGMAGLYAWLTASAPHEQRLFFDPIIAPALPAQAYLWIFLPPLLFQAALAVDVRELLDDVAPVLLLAVVAVFVSTAVVGLAVAWLGAGGLAAGLLLGAVIATTDPSAVIAIFERVGAPARLTRLVEGESLLNDAAAIAISTVLVAYLTGDAATATPLAGLKQLAWTFLGGLVFGGLAGRLGVGCFPFMGARMMVLFGLFPLLSRYKLAEPISSAYKLAITWGGLRGAVTLVLALGIAESAQLPAETRHFIAILATGFVLFSLFVNGSTLSKVIQMLGLSRLSPQDEALQQQALRLSAEEVGRAVQAAAAAFRIDAKVADAVSAEYRRDMDLSAAALDLDSAISERDRLSIGLVALAAKEHDLITQYGEGVLTVANLDAMMRNASLMRDAARSEGRLGYNRAARRILATTWVDRLVRWLHERLHIDYPLIYRLSNRFELLMCRRAVLEQLRNYVRQSMVPLLGSRMGDVLQNVLQTRIDSANAALTELRTHYGQYTAVLERRLLVLYALRDGREQMECMMAEHSISKEVYDWVMREIDQAWKKGIRRPRLHGHHGGPARS